MIRVHLITGFLGTGKTTAILDLLTQVPAGQKWAVLVNEFGEVGVDGAILTASGAVVREVPGGCLCCVSGLPFQMGLNMLIAREKPDVILIEPTGLGHPRKVLETLRNEHYRDLLEPGANLCLIDPRHLSQSRYTSNDTFMDQIQLSDVLVANKTDACPVEDLERFTELAEASVPPKAAVIRTTYGKLDISLLSLPADPLRLTLQDHTGHHHHSRKETAPVALAPGERFHRFEGHGEGHFSVGWLLAGDQIFNLDRLRHWFDLLDVERAKGLLRTTEGYYVFNWREGVLSEMPTRALEESRLEIISATPPDHQTLQDTLFQCLETNG